MDGIDRSGRLVAHQGYRRVGEEAGLSSFSRGFETGRTYLVDELDDKAGRIGVDSRPRDGLTGRVRTPECGRDGGGDLDGGSECAESERGGEGFEAVHCDT